MNKNKYFILILRGLVSLLLLMQVEKKLGQSLQKLLEGYFNNWKYYADSWFAFGSPTLIRT